MALVVTAMNSSTYKWIKWGDNYLIWDTVAIDAEQVTGSEIRERVLAGQFYNNLNMTIYGEIFMSGVFGDTGTVLDFNEDALVMRRGNALYVYSGGRMFELFIDGMGAIGFSLSKTGFVLKDMLVDVPSMGLGNMQVQAKYYFSFRDMGSLCLYEYRGKGCSIEGISCTKKDVPRIIAML